MTSDEQSALRAMLREEINAAVYASEQRLGERIDKLETTIDKLETTVTSMDERLTRVEFVQKQMTINLAQVVSVLDEATIKINDLQRSQIALETKVEENTASLKRDLQKLNYPVCGFMDNMVDAVAGITMRLDMHRDTPRAFPNSQKALQSVPKHAQIKCARISRNEIIDELEKYILYLFKHGTVLLI